MQNALDLNGTETGLIDAKILRDMTITKEQLFDRQKNSLLESLMSSMVRVASENGGTVFNATLNPKFDPVMLDSIVETLKGLNYTVNTSRQTDPSVGELTVITVGW